MLPLVVPVVLANYSPILHLMEIVREDIQVILAVAVMVEQPTLVELLDRPVLLVVVDKVRVQEVLQVEVRQLVLLVVRPIQVVAVVVLLRVLVVVVDQV